MNQKREPSTSEGESELDVPLDVLAIQQAMAASRELLIEPMSEDEWNFLLSDIPSYFHSTERLSQSRIEAAQKLLAANPANWRAIYAVSTDLDEKDLSISIVKAGLDKLAGDLDWFLSTKRNQTIHSFLFQILVEKYLVANTGEYYELAMIALRKALQVSSYNTQDAIGLMPFAFRRAQERQEWDDILELVEITNLLRGTWETCRAMLDGAYMYASFNDAVVRAAEARSRLDILDLMYQPAIDMAIKRNEVDELCWLRYCYSYALNFHISNQARVLKLWDEVMQHLPKLKAKRETLLWCVRRYVAPTYLQKAVEAGQDSETATRYLARIRSMSTVAGAGGNALSSTNVDTRNWAKNETALCVARYYQKSRNFERARIEAAETMNRCLALLSDNDPSNDSDAYWWVCAACATCDDDENAVAAFQMIVRTWIQDQKAYEKKKAEWEASHLIKSNKDDLQSAEGQPEEAEVFTKEKENGKTVLPAKSPQTDEAAGNPTSDVATSNTDQTKDGDPEDTPPRQETSAAEIEKDESPPKEPDPVCWCDDCGDAVDATKNDVWWCRHCPGTRRYDDKCYQKILEGTMGTHLCKESHGFLRIPKLDLPDLNTMPAGSIPVGEKVVTLDLWKESLRAKYPA